MKEPFLKLVAQAYAKNMDAGDLADVCFIFPTKRNVAFFLKYLNDSLGETPHIEPEAITISDFIMSLSPLSEATRYEQLFILYNEYAALSPELSDFDKFIFWGEMILSDFNDVDRHLVDPDELFRNLKELREINSTYLTEDQRDIIRRYWGDDVPGDHLTRFWTHSVQRSITMMTHLALIPATVSLRFGKYWESYTIISHSDLKMMGWPLKECSIDMRHNA